MTGFGYYFGWLGAPRSARMWLDQRQHDANGDEVAMG